ncbi:MAG: GDSL-type esterase/lipase family protein [Thiomicrorhabdus sp.]|nr:GDSL-type esterase/lipase family protein [Thiomicrorhabdus sp.]
MKTYIIPGLYTSLRGGMIILSVLWLTACSSAKIPQLQADDVVLAFGDSLTAGYGVKPSNSYPEVLANMTGLNVINSGISGETTAEGLARLPMFLEQHQPGLVILLEGGNDQLQTRPYDEIKANLHKMIRLIKASGASVILVSVPQKKLFGGSLELYSELAEEFDLPIEDDIVASLMARPSMKSDYVHFNDKGYQALAEAIYEVMQTSGAI